MTADSDALSGSRAVVFGGAGFLGSAVTKALLAAGCDVTVFDASEPAHAHARTTYVRGDICDADAVRGVVPGADHVFGLAGGLGATRSLADPLADLRSSCMAQVTLLEAVRELAPAASVLLPGSRLEYGRPEYLPVDETHPLCGGSPYAIDRSTCAAYYRFYAEVHGLRTVVLRLSNPYGPHAALPAGRPAFGILNAFVDTALRGETILLYGGGTQLRDFVHVDDVVDAMLAASTVRAAAGRAINIGTGAGVSLRAAAETVVRAAGRGSIRDVPWPDDAAAVETGDFRFDIALARSVLGWEPRVGLEDGIARLVSDSEGGHA